ncbi:MAG TPA: CpsD/CapB family tyrosine-protein kinase [Acidobacteriota bacterium]|nr:CpsD/CapB family tyrosine-protein kinase [Acidobacteriota bacterium]
MLTEHHMLAKIRKLQEEEKTGILLLGKEGRKIEVYFRDGLIDGAGSDISQLQLARILARRGDLQASAIPELLKKARRKRVVIGRAAVEDNVLEIEGLREGVFEQIIHTLSYAINNEFDVNEFKAKPFDLYLPARLDYGRLTLGLARINGTPIHLDSHSLLSLSNGHCLSQYPWYPRELSVLSQLKTPRTLHDLASTTGLEYDEISRILSVLNSLELIRRVEDSPGESMAVVKRDRMPLEHLIPEISNASLSDKLETFHNQSSFISEQFRTLKVSIAKASAQRPLDVIAVTSPEKGEGKSLVSVNLAYSFSQSPVGRVIVVDCDLRDPALHRYLGTTLEPGLLGFLEGNLQPYCYMRRFEKLYFMTAGGTTDSSIELLSGERMTDMIAALRAEFDLVILDCPPFGPIADAQVLTGLADGMLMIARSGKTTYDALEKSFKTLDKSKLIGMVFNDVRPTMLNTHYYYKYYGSGGRHRYSAAKTMLRNKKTYIDR